MIVPWSYIASTINEEIEPVRTHEHDRLALKDIRDSLYFPEHPYERAAKNLLKLIAIIEELNRRGAFLRDIKVTQNFITIPTKDDLLEIIRNLSSYIDHKFEDYFQDLSYEIRSQNIDIYNTLLKELLDVKNSLTKPLIQLIHAHKDKLLPNIKEFHSINKKDWEYFKDTYSSWKIFWKKLKKSLKFERILVLVFQCPSCNNTYRFLFLQETKFSRIMKILLKIAPYLGEFLAQKIPTDIQFTKIEKKPEIDINVKKLLPDEISFLYQTLIGIESEDSKTLAETFKFDEDKLNFTCIRCQHD